MAPVVPFLYDTSIPFKQVLAAERTSQSIQAWIFEKRDAIQAIKKQAIDHEIPYDMIYLDIKALEKEISGYKRLLESNESSRRLWRAFHMASWRPTVRRLKVVDLPYEILTMIFVHLEDIPTWPIQVDSRPCDEHLPKTDVASIINIRRTCRSFCEAGSRFLLPVVDISFTKSSVQRLEKISNHPTISKGVRIIRIHADAYSSLLADNWRGFLYTTLFQLSKIQSKFKAAAERARREVKEDCHLLGLIPRPTFLKIRVHEMALRDTRDLMAIVQKCKDRYDSGDLPLDPLEEKISKAIMQAYEEYKQKYLEQQSLAGDAQFCANISTAIGMMPSVQRLCITTESRSPQGTEILSVFDEPLDAQKWRSAFVSPNPFRSMMVHTDCWNPTLLRWVGQPPFSWVLKLPLALQAGSRNLTQLDIDFPPVRDSLGDIAAEHLQNLRLACQQLKFVQIRLSQHIDTDLGPPWFLSTIYTLLEAMLVSSGLEEVKIDLAALDDPEDFGEPDATVAPLLASISWDKLRTLHLANVPIEIEQLRELLAKAPGTIRLDLSNIYLLEGTWAEALEILRGRVDSSSRVVNPGGTELDELSEEEADNLRHEFDMEYRDGWYSAQRCPGPASFYIRGGNVPNPLVRVDE